MTNCVPVTFICWIWKIEVSQFGPHRSQNNKYTKQHYQRNSSKKLFLRVEKETIKNRRLRLFTYTPYFSWGISIHESYTSTRNWKTYKENYHKVAHGTSFKEEIEEAPSLQQEEDQVKLELDSGQVLNQI